MTVMNERISDTDFQAIVADVPDPTVRLSIKFEVSWEGQGRHSANFAFAQNAEEACAKAIEFYELPADTVVTAKRFRDLSDGHMIKGVKPKGFSR